ncbi:aldehyde dehydrogenase family protein [Nocardia sp. NPDC004123]
MLTGVPAEAEMARTENGLAAYLYTRDIARVVCVCEALEFGMVGVNRGVVSEPAIQLGGMKESGFGREGSVEGLDEYLETKYLVLAI